MQQPIESVLQKAKTAARLAINLAKRLYIEENTVFYNGQRFSVDSSSSLSFQTSLVRAYAEQINHLKMRVKIF